MTRWIVANLKLMKIFAVLAAILTWLDHVTRSHSDTCTVKKNNFLYCLRSIYFLEAFDKLNYDVLFTRRSMILCQLSRINRILAAHSLNWWMHFRQLMFKVCSGVRQDSADGSVTISNHSTTWLTVVCKWPHQLRTFVRRDYYLIPSSTSTELQRLIHTCENYRANLAWYVN